MSDATSSSVSARLAALFPDAEPVATVTSPPSRRPSVRMLAIVGFVIVALVVAIASGVFNSSGSGYRTAAASTQNVDAALSGVATIEPTLQATVAFPSSGTVATVGVKVGDKVTAGQTLAQLQTQSLQQTVDQQTATLTQDQLALSNALSGKGGATSGLGGTGAGAGGAGTGTAGAASWTTPSAGPHVELVAVRSATSPALTAAQQAVLAAQQQVDHAQATAASAVSAAVSACQGSLSTPAAQTACNNAVQTLNADETAVQAALSSLTAASNNLAQIISQLPTSSNSGGASPSAGGASSSAGGASSSAGSGRSGVTGGGGGGVSGGSTATAADLSADQAAVDAALANVAVAQQALAQATLTSPIAGTVDAVNIVPGQSVSAGSTTANVVVRGSATYQVATTVSVDNIPHVAVGQSATVVPDGKHKTLSGKVASISIVPSSSSALSTSYLVVVALKNPTVDLGNASTGTVTIVTQHAKSTLAVPTSAVTTNGTTNTVEVLDGSTVRQQRVRVGVVGYTWTQITSGLKRGELVVLANVAAPLPGSATTSSNSSTSTTTPLGGAFFGGRGGEGAGGAVFVPRGG
ncbi:MAG TPA: HlyD family efflux transporter periplasmic adaptor subunit [Acidimicrobiia bacterium]|nr:HlyD family efflux transporter periplasmic adaptor subunit [Acidimicrobiia bacterium]